MLVFGDVGDHLEQLLDGSENDLALNVFVNDSILIFAKAKLGCRLEDDQCR